MTDESASHPDRGDHRDGDRELDARRAALSVFARRITHDLNNFATIIQTYTELVLPEVESPTARADLGEVQAAAGEMVGYLRRIVRFSRIESMSLLPVNVATVVSELVATLQEDKGHAPLRIDGACTLQVQADPSWLRDITRELIRNACEASPSGSTVVVELLEHDSHDDGGARWVVLRITDEGPGFADAIALNAEDPFVTTKEGVRGAGFGLTLASAFAGRVGGRLVRRRAHECTHVELWMPGAGRHTPET